MTEPASPISTADDEKRDLPDHSREHTLSRQRTCVHSYRPLKENYYKRKATGESTGLGTPAVDHSLAYTMLYCSKCGLTMEVVSGDHRALPEAR